jgi:hypothetical protein
MGNDFINRLAYAAAFTKAALHSSIGRGYNPYLQGLNYGAQGGHMMHPWGGMGSYGYGLGPYGVGGGGYVSASPHHWSGMHPSLLGYVGEGMSEGIRGVRNANDLFAQQMPGIIQGQQIGLRGRDIEEQQEALGREQNLAAAKERSPTLEREGTLAGKAQETASTAPLVTAPDQTSITQQAEFLKAQQVAEAKLQALRDARTAAEEKHKASLVQVEGNLGSLSNRYDQRELAISEATKQVDPQSLVDKGVARDLEHAKSLIANKTMRTGWGALLSPLQTVPAISESVMDAVRPWTTSPELLGQAARERAALVAQHAKEMEQHRAAIEAQDKIVQGYKKDREKPLAASQAAAAATLKQQQALDEQRRLIAGNAANRQGKTIEKVTDQSIRNLAPKPTTGVAPITAQPGMGNMPTMPKLPAPKPVPAQVASKLTPPAIANTPPMTVSASAPFSVKELAAMAAYVQMRKRGAANKPLGVAPAPSGVASAPVVKKPSTGGFLSNIGSAVSSAMPARPVDPSAAKYVQPPPLHTPQDPLRPVLDPLGRPIPTVPAGVGASLQVANNTQGGARPGSLARGSGQTLSTVPLYRNAS